MTEADLVIVGGGPAGLAAAIHAAQRGLTSVVLRSGTRGLMVETAWGPVGARLLVGADGLLSRVRREAGLELPWRGRRRFGVRRHFRLRPWSPFVEVHWAEGIEAYITPAGPSRIGRPP